MTAMTLGVLRETAPGERRVALVPDLVHTLDALGVAVLVERGAGAGALFHDEAYAAAGAGVVSRAEILRHADLLVGVQAPHLGPTHRYRPGQLLVAMVASALTPFQLWQWADQGVTAIGLDLVPDTLGAGYPMDALASQARISGYRAVLIAAERLRRCLPPWGSTETTFEPVRALVVGAGPAGLQAVDTARRLGALVHAHELRRRARVEVAELGGTLLDLPGLRPVDDAAGLARALDSELAELRQGLADVLPRFDIVIAALDPPGRPAPMVLTTEAVQAMRPGSVVVDLTSGTSGTSGGNVQCAAPGILTLVGDALSVIGAGNLPAQAPVTASTAYAHNVSALLHHLKRSGPLTIDLSDPVQAAIVVTHHGSVLKRPTGQLLLGATAGAGPG
ncbi:NAD(P) transhydrogenase subunit alpha [Kitasatospora sp. MAA4]|uniref:NAD(P) transhydrogenase subunit alpha n=1 Tax=Kitasatospora sp. MAA4 TaxID=3035093 RepID=UPI0024772DB9|nr:NAD(P) transhydrogenase subunit alpha [Kitasatospora sp. MAA4]MDH6136854.1 NAD(P) transhydrogenase subunit alpha [Kitasatospora sp. MAA4]